LGSFIPAGVGEESRGGELARILAARSGAGERDSSTGAREEEDGS